MRKLSRASSLGPYLLTSLLFVFGSSTASALKGERISLENARILVGENEPSFVRYGAEDLAAYLKEITHSGISITTKAPSGAQQGTAIVVGEQMATALGTDLLSVGSLGKEGSIIRSYERSGNTIVVVAGQDPHGTNTGLALLLQLIRVEGKAPYIDGPLDFRNVPSLSVRGIQSGGWPIKYPYAAWKEEDWKRFIDMVWLLRGNRLLLAPLFEILPVPLSPEDEAYVQEVRRIVDYAETKRGIEVWVGMPANRIAISNCNVRDPRKRPYWINGCQKDFNPADSVQFAKVLQTVEAFYQIVNNPDGILMGDADPGGWPNSPLSEQVKIFQAHRRFLDQYNIHGKKAKLADFMWIGWGRHKFFTSTDRLVTGFDWTEKNPDESDIQFMAATIANFKQHLPQPWEVFAGMTPYLESAKREAVLQNTIYFPYGAIEGEPAFPATNIALEPVRDVVDKIPEYPGLSSLMGNNQITVLQFPMTFYFFESTWDKARRNDSQEDVLLGVSQQLYPEHAQLLRDALLALYEVDVRKIENARSLLQELISRNDVGRMGALGRYLHPDPLIVARTLQKQLEIRAARQSLVSALIRKPSQREAAQLLERYFDLLLAWNTETGWENVFDSGIWTLPIYQDGKDLQQSMSVLKELLGGGAPYTTYAQVNAFFDPIGKRLLKKYGQNSVMLGCVQPFKLAVAQKQ